MNLIELTIIVLFMIYLLTNNGHGDKVKKRFIVPLFEKKVHKMILIIQEVDIC